MLITPCRDVMLTLPSIAPNSKRFSEGYSTVRLSAGRTAQFLVAIHLAIGHAHQLAHVAAVFRVIHNADADAAANHSRTEVERGLVDVMPHTLDHRLRNFRGSARQQ